MGNKIDGIEKLAELVKKARGERSIRQYAMEANVNPTTISRIEAKEYKPGTKVLKKLTSKEAAPRGGVTLQDLMKATGYASGYVEEYTKAIASVGAMVAGIAIGGPVGMGAATVTAAGMILSEKLMKTEYAYDKINPVVITKENYEKHLRQHSKFQATAVGLIYNTLAEKGVSFIPGNRNRKFDAPAPDCFITIVDQDINDWWFQFVGVDDEWDKIINLPTWDKAQQYIMRYLLIEPDSVRKISIVTDDQDLFRKMCSYKGRNSFRGNFSVILVDMNEVKIVSEHQIAYFDTNEVLTLNLSKEEQL